MSKETLYISSIYLLSIGDSFGPETHTRKVSNIHKGIELYQVLMNNVLCLNAPMFCYTYSLQEESIHFGLRVSSKKFGLEVSAQEKSLIFIKIFRIMPSFNQ